MGMYTEVFFRAEVMNLPDPAQALLTAVSSGDFESAEHAADQIDHEFFRKDRWLSVFCGCSAYFESDGGTVFKQKQYPICGGNDFSLQVQSSLKNYDGEAEAFFDWIRPYTAEAYIGGGFVGYTLYEEADSPILYYADGTTRVADRPEDPEVTEGLDW